MNLYIGKYDWGSRGAYSRRECIIRANTESEALGMALEVHGDTKACDWTITPLPEEVGCYTLSWSES